MFFPMIFDTGVDNDTVVVVMKATEGEKVATKIPRIKMEHDLANMSHSLLAGNEAWGKWATGHPADWSRYKVWFRKASHVQKYVIPSMAFDFSYMSLAQARARFLMIADVYKRLMLDVPSVPQQVI